jgi:hypothetical protein
MRHALIAAVLLAATNANAAPITYMFSGTWTSVNPFGVVGQSFTGEFIFDTEAALIPGTATEGLISTAVYDASEMSWWLTTGAQTFTGSGGGIYIYNRAPDYEPLF